MKIAIVAPFEESIPPILYGGIEWIIYELAQGLGEKGHTIDLYATGDSLQKTEYNLLPTAPKSLRKDLILGSDNNMREAAKLYYLGKTVQQLQSKKYDIIHNHCGWRFLAASPLLVGPILTTHHMPLSIPFQAFVFNQYKDYPYISISNNQRKDLPSLNFLGTIYNGIDLHRFPFYGDVTPEDNYLLFFARFSPEKGGLEAIQAAKYTQKPLKIGAKVDLVDQSYFIKAKPYIDNKIITSIGELSQDVKDKVYQHARALLVPVMWEEPFGLMFIEAMACGTPVITFSRGSAPEVIKDGFTGFLVNQSAEYIRGDYIIKKTGVEGLVEAINRMYDMPKDEYKQMRRDSREHVEKNFSNKKMVEEYEKIYKKILTK